MFVPRIRTMGLAVAAALGLAACTDGYGYSGVSVGYGSAGYYDPYYDGYGYGGYGGGYGASSYYGWYDGFYYPGTGYYVYGRDRRPVRWSNAHRRYWEGRGRSWQGERRANWGGWDRRDGRGNDGRGNWRRDDDRRGEWRGDRRTDRPVPGIRVDERGDRRPVYRGDGRPDTGSRPNRGRPDRAPRTEGARPDRVRPDTRPERPRTEGAQPQRRDWGGRGNRGDVSDNRGRPRQN